MASASTSPIARVRLAGHTDQSIEVRVPHTDYCLRLALATPGATLPELGKRIEGSIVADALRIHPAQGGGRFIEPVSGEPRIVAGIVREIEDDRVLIDAGVPMWLTLAEGQDRSVLTPGGLVNCYVRDASIQLG